MRTGHLYRSADAAVRARIQRAAVHRAAGIAAEQLDDAALLANPLGLDNAAVVHDGLQQDVSGLRREDHRAIGRDDRAAILHGRSQRRGAHLEMRQAVAGEAEIDRAARAQRGGAARCADPPFIVHRRADERDVAAGRRRDAALVHHSIGAAAGEMAVSGIEILVGDIVRGHHQPADAHLRAGGEIDPVRIDQEHLTVGVDMAVDRAGIGAQHAVQHHAAGARLAEVHRLAGADTEALPVDDGALAGLVDVERVGVWLLQACLPADHLPAGRQSGRRERKQNQSKRNGSCCQFSCLRRQLAPQPTRQAPTAQRCGRFRNRHQHA